ncbi:PAS domain S-box protein [Delftia sp. DT-2]|uniref:PAS domain S-box protein n=1 Tax=Delftia sp. DT-2 TaxID=3022772 RepID=UPI00233F6A32|nr:PAS domain S-box protein [Delftia sp. DT-2]MDC2862352.1 PAS domain S-box protein [Delftia sp. DT-2]
MGFHRPRCPVKPGQQPGHPVRRQPRRSARGGRLVGFAGSAVDVTARWKAQQELQTQLAFQHLLFETTPLPMLVTDADHRVVLVNKAWEDFFGPGRYAVLGHEIKGLHSRDDALLQIRSNQVVMRSGQRMVLEARLPHMACSVPQ